MAKSRIGAIFKKHCLKGRAQCKITEMKHDINICLIIFLLYNDQEEEKILFYLGTSICPFNVGTKMTFNGNKCIFT